MRARRAARRPSPTTVIAGARTPASAARAAMSASVPLTVRWSANVPRWTTATGSLGGRPPATSCVGDAVEAAHAHVEDERAGERGQRRPVDERVGLGRVLVAGDERDRARRRRAASPGSPRRRAPRRRPSRPARPRSPGRLARRSCASSPPRPKTNGSPPFSRTTSRPARAWRSSSSFVVSCGTCSPPPILPTSTSSASGARAVERAVGDELVVEDDVGARDRARARARS